MEKRNALESYVYQVRDWMNGKDGALLNPDVVNPYLDKAVLWFEDADMADEPTTFEAYSEKLAEVEGFVKKEGAAYFEKKAKAPFCRWLATRMELRSSKIKRRRSRRLRPRSGSGGRSWAWILTRPGEPSLVGKHKETRQDERVMKKEDRIRLAQKNKDEGNEAWSASAPRGCKNWSHCGSVV